MQSSNKSQNNFLLKTNNDKEYEINNNKFNSNDYSDNTFSRNSVKSENEKESYYKSEPAYNHLNLIFFKLFSEHNYNPEDKFEKNVWFLKNNLEFQKFLSSSENSENYGKTPEGLSASQNSQLIRILQECQIGSATKNLSKNFLVEVKKFVNEISKVLFDANQRKQSAEEMVKHYKMDEMKERILDKLQKERSTLNFLSDITEIQFAITKLENFPEGFYDFFIACEAFVDAESAFIQRQEINKKLLSNKKISINSANLSIGQKLNNPELFEVIEIRNEKNFEYLNLDEVCLGQSKFREEASYIGLLLNNFKFAVFKENIFFAASEKEMLIDNLINQLEMLLKDRAFKCSSAAFAYVDSANKNYVKAGLENTKLVVYYDLEINFNKKSKLLLLEKIYNVFYDTITSKFDNEKVINSILDYFHEVSRDIKNVLDEKKDFNPDKCNPCLNCSVF